MSDIQQSFPIVKNMTWLPLIAKKKYCTTEMNKRKTKVKNYDKANRKHWPREASVGFNQLLIE